MPSYTLTDTSKDTWVDMFEVSAAKLGHPAAHPWSVTKTTLRGGRRDGVDLIRLDNGALSVAIVPTRGMGLWRGNYHGDAIGWKSPVVDGPVNPQFVNPSDRGGLGWLDGFDELLARCGLVSNGSPYSVPVLNADGSTARTDLVGLHGRIANIPAHYVAVHVDDAAPHAITIEGRVAESTLFHPQLELSTRISTVPGSNHLVVRDEVTNLSDSPGEFQILYHWNFGQPYLGLGSKVVAPIDTLVPRDPRAAEGIDAWDTYAGPTPGFAEQVYLARLRGDGPDGRTLVLLHDAGGKKGVALRYSTAQLPCFSLWKATGGLKDGYVTGLEPGTNYPHPKPLEKARGRVIPLAPGGSHVAETVLEILDTPDAVAAIAAEIRKLQGPKPPTIHRGMIEPFVPMG
ncbi:aldose 1-epimerase family protein [Tundrisphaera sp. TA3]|uniref:aldose 1-epimerase family protein n=1 Tax=Tundrisphaera sp. TA3 TaxID=3435775 RepID=UPI003EBFA61E